MALTNGKYWVLVFVAVLILAHSSVGKQMTLEFIDAEYADIFSTIADAMGLNALIDPSVTGKTSLSLGDVELTEGLDLLMARSGFAYRIVGSTLLVASQERLADFEKREFRYIQVRHMSSERILSALRFVLDVGDIFVDENSGLVILQGIPSHLNQAEEMLRLLDVPGELNVETAERDLLDILYEITKRLQIDLVADPSLREVRVAVRLEHTDPFELLETLERMFALDMELTADTLIVHPTEDAEQPAERERLKVYRLNYASPQQTADVLGMLVPQGQIQHDTSSVMVLANREQMAAVDQFIADFDSPPPQVLIEALVQEISTDALRSLGVEWKGVPSFRGSTGIPTFLELEWEPWELFLALKALEEQGDSTLLARPQIATISGEQASIFIGDVRPIILRRQLEDGSIEEQVSDFQAGIELQITPRISDDGYITTTVRPRVSNFTQTIGDLPQTRTREAQTTVRVKDGQPIVIGGLIEEQTRESVTKVPIVSSLPIFGRLFQWTDVESRQTEMVIFLIPRIMDGQWGVGTSRQGL